MHTIRTLLLVFVLLGIGVHFSRVRLIEADMGVIRVPNDFPTIQEAIDAAENGSTILVNSGIYYEHIVINKTLTLLGASKEDTIIDGEGFYKGGNVVVVTADNVIIDGFTVRKSSQLFAAGIHLSQPRVLLSGETL